MFKKRGGNCAPPSLFLILADSVAQVHEERILVVLIKYHRCSYDEEAIGSSEEEY